MPSGTVKWFNAVKRFGFIGPDDGDGDGKDVFVHVTAVQGAGLQTLVEGQHLEYELKTMEDGRVCASDLKLLEE